ILEAAVFFRSRLPEAFAGYERARIHYPVEYPTACSPQAWSTGAPLLFLRTLLGLEPIGDHLLVDPAIPTTIESIQLLTIPGRWRHADAFGRGLVNLTRTRVPKSHAHNGHQRAPDAAPAEAATARTGSCASNFVSAIIIGVASLLNSTASAESHRTTI